MKISNYTAIPRYNNYQIYNKNINAKKQTPNQTFGNSIQRKICGESFRFVKNKYGFRYFQSENIFPWLKGQELAEKIKVDVEKQVEEFKKLLPKDTKECLAKYAKAYLNKDIISVGYHEHNFDYSNVRVVAYVYPDELFINGNSLLNEQMRKHLLENYARKSFIIEDPKCIVSPSDEAGRGLRFAEYKTVSEIDAPINTL